MKSRWILLLCLLLAGCTALPAATLPTAALPPSPSPTPDPTATPPPTLPPTALFTPAPLATPTPACTETAGQTESFSIEAESLHKQLKFMVHYPPCYRADAFPGYPVLYMLHGQGSTEQLWLDLGLGQAADRLVSSGEIPPLLIVMPWEEYQYDDPFETGYEEALANTLVSWVDASLPVCGGRGCRAIGGLSRGAAWAVHLGFSRWETFGAIGAHSLPPFYGDFRRLPGWVDAIPPGSLPAVLMDIGEKDPYMPIASEFEALLTREEVPHAWWLLPGAHDAEYWSSHVEDYLRWYAAQFQISSDFESCDVCDFNHP